MLLMISLSVEATKPVLFVSNMDNWQSLINRLMILSMFMILDCLSVSNFYVETLSAHLEQGA